MLTPTSSEASFILVGGDATSQVPANNLNESANESEGGEATQVVKDDTTASESQKAHHPSIEIDYAPGSSSSFAHDWSTGGTGGKLSIHGRHFFDAHGRVCSLRGVNLSGSSKTPVNHDHGVFPDGHKTATFVGRPFPLEDARQHLARLRRWGLTFIRFLVTWEAVEHSGLGIYDKEYLTYIRHILSLLPQYGMTAFVVIHQDVWSRYSGGSGAPAWTLEAIGFDLHALEESAAAWLLGVKGGGHNEAERGVWPCGYTKLAAATMATLFWGGDTFAPKLKIKVKDGSEVPVQQFLQGAFLDMFGVLVRAVGDLEGVLGFEMLNEPHPGYINLPSLHSFNYNTDLHLSYIPSAFQSFLLGSGHPTSVPIWTRSFPMPTRLTSHGVLNPLGRKVWLPNGPTGGKCVWEMHGVWGWDVDKNEGVVLRENYFVKHPMDGRKINWYNDFYYPFLRKWGERVRSVSPPEKLLFVEPITNEFCPASWTLEKQLPNMVFSPHWYCLNSLFMKAFGDITWNVQGLSRGLFFMKAMYWGQKGARKNFSLQIRNIVESGYRSLGEVPVIIGECGVPMDMNEREAFKTNDWTWQTRMMDAMITGLENSLVGFTLWNYNPENDDKLGDDWNGENFSWFSLKRALPASLLHHEQTSASLDHGGRILSAVVRPYPAKTAGIPLRFQYEMNTGEFIYEWANPDEKQQPIVQGEATISQPPLTGHPTLTSRETEIFVPAMLTARRKVIVHGLGPEDKHVYDISRQTLFIVTRDSSAGKIHKIKVTLHPLPEEPMFDVHGFWDDHWARIFAILIVIFGIIAQIYG